MSKKIQDNISIKDLEESKENVSFNVKGYLPLCR